MNLVMSDITRNKLGCYMAQQASLNNIPVSVSMSFISCLLFSQRRRTAPPAYYLSAKPKRGTDTVRHNVLAVLPVDVVQQVDFPQRAIVNAQLVVGVFDSVSV